MSLVRRGALWSYAGELYLTGGQFILGIILARLLGPAEFGVFIAVSAFTSLLLIITNLALPQAMLQAKRLTAEQINAAFWAMTTLSLLTLAATVGLAWPLSRIYAAPSLQGVMIAMGSTLLLTPYTALGLSLLRRRMAFEQVARINMRAFSLSALVSVAAAMAGAGVYSLVIGAIASMLVIALGIADAEPWRPGRPRIAPVRALLGYAGFATVNNLIGISANRVDNMLLGVLLGTAPLALYNRAYSLARIPSDQFAESIGPLLMTSLAKSRDDRVAARALYFKAVAAITALTLPLLALLGVAGPLAIDLLYGADWSGAGRPLQVMVVGAVLLVLALNMRVLINALGLVRELVRINLILLATTIGVVTLLAPFGLVAVAIGISAREALMLLLTAQLLRRSPLRLRLAEVWYAAMPALISAAVSLPVGTLVAARHGDPDAASPLFALILIAGAVFATYGTTLGLLMLFWRNHAPLASLRLLVLTTGRAAVGRALGSTRRRPVRP